MRLEKRLEACRSWLQTGPNMAKVSSLDIRARIGFYILWIWEVLKGYIIGCAWNQLWIWGATKWHAWEPSQSSTWWGSWISCAWWTCVAIRTRICWGSWRAGSIILLSLPSRLADSTSGYWVSSSSSSLGDHMVVFYSNGDWISLHQFVAFQKIRVYFSSSCIVTSFWATKRTIVSQYYLDAFLILLLHIVTCPTMSVVCELEFILPSLALWVLEAREPLEK